MNILSGWRALAARDAVRTTLVAAMILGMLAGGLVLEEPAVAQSSRTAPKRHRTNRLGSICRTNRQTSRDYSGKPNRKIPFR